MGKEYFWKDWKRISNLELKGISTIISVKKLILRNFPNKEIYSIYVKGSFVYRELNERSDIDFLVILRHSKYLLKVKELEKRYKNTFKLPIHLGSNSLYELKKGRHSKFNKSPGGTTNRIAQQISSFEIVYGNKIKSEKLPKREDIEDLKSLINAYQKVVIPSYEEGKLDFGSIIKSTYWLVENEERVKGHSLTRSWNGLTRHIKDRKHIIHQAYKYRTSYPKLKRTKLKYVKRLKNYLKKLRKVYC